MKAIYKLHIGQVDGVDQFKVYDFNPCTIEHVNSNYVKEAMVMLQYILDAESLKGNTDGKVRLPYTMALINMKKVYGILQKSRATLSIEVMINDFSAALAELMAVLEGGKPQYEKWFEKLIKEIYENNKCL